MQPTEVVKSTDDGPFESIRSLAIAIAGSPISHSTEQRHLGLIVRPERESLLLIHMGWQGADKFYCEAPNARYCWVLLPHLDPYLQDSLADWIYTVWKRNPQGFPYSITYSQDRYFGDLGHVRTLQTGEGFTCSTFVLECFGAYQLPLVDRDTWPARSREDKPWQETILAILRVSAPDQANAQIEAIGRAVRYRPEEVAGAASLFDGVPVPFAVAASRSAYVLEGMRRAKRL